MDVPTLLGLGLDEHLAEVWTAMAAAPGAGVGELAEMLGLPEARIREILDELADRALIRDSHRQPGLLVPVPAETAMAHLLRRQEEELAEQQRRFAEQRDRITQAVAAEVTARRFNHAPDEDDEVQHFVGTDAILHCFERLSRTTSVSADSLTPVAEIPAGTLADARPLHAELLRRGILMRSLYPEAVRTDPPTAGYALDLQAGGAQVRTSPALPQRLFLFDRRVALIPLDPSVRSRDVAVVRTPEVVTALLELFEAVWRNAAPLDIGNQVDPATGLSATERTLLNMLAGGATDEVVARRLGMSLRTVRRIMADLMRRLGAASRFEAGIKAAKRGWL